MEVEIFKEHHQSPSNYMVTPLPTVNDTFGYELSNTELETILLRNGEGYNQQYLVFEFTFSFDVYYTGSDESSFELIMSSIADLSSSGYERSYFFRQNSNTVETDIEYNSNNNVVDKSAFTNDALDGGGPSGVDITAVDTKRTIRLIVENNGSATWQIYSETDGFLTFQKYVLSGLSSASENINCNAIKVVVHNLTADRTLYVEGFRVYKTDTNPVSQGVDSYATDIGPSNENTQRVVIATDQPAINTTFDVAKDAGNSDSNTLRVVIVNDQSPIDVNTSGGASKGPGDCDSNTTRVVICDDNVVTTSTSAREYIFKELVQTATNEDFESGTQPPKYLGVGWRIINGGTMLRTVQKTVVSRARNAVFEFSAGIDGLPTDTGPNGDAIRVALQVYNGTILMKYYFEWQAEANSIIRVGMETDDDEGIYVKNDQFNGDKVQGLDDESGIFLYQQYDGNGRFRKLLYQLEVYDNGGVEYRIYSRKLNRYVRLHYFEEAELDDLLPFGSNGALYLNNESLSSYLYQVITTHNSNVDVELYIDGFSVYLIDHDDPSHKLPLGRGIAKQRDALPVSLATDFANYKNDDYSYINTSDRVYIFLIHWSDPPSALRSYDHYKTDSTTARWEISTNNGFDLQAQALDFFEDGRNNQILSKFRGQYVVMEATFSIPSLESGSPGLVLDWKNRNGTAGRSYKLLQNSDDFKIEVDWGSTTLTVSSTDFNKDKLDGTGESEISFNDSNVQFLDVKQTVRIIAQDNGSIYWQIFSHAKTEFVTFHTTVVTDFSQSDFAVFADDWKFSASATVAGTYLDGASAYATNDTTNLLTIGHQHVQLQSEFIQEECKYVNTSQRHFLFNEVYSNPTNDIAVNTSTVAAFRGWQLAEGTSIETVWKRIWKRGKYFIFEFTGVIPAIDVQGYNYELLIRSNTEDTNIGNVTIKCSIGSKEQASFSTNVAFEYFGTTVNFTNDTSSFKHDDLNGKGPSKYQLLNSDFAVARWTQKNTFRIIYENNGTVTFQIYSPSTNKFVTFHDLTRQDYSDDIPADLVLQGNEVSVLIAVADEDTNVTASAMEVDGFSVWVTDDDVLKQQIDDTLKSVVGPRQTGNNFVNANNRLYMFTSAWNNYDVDDFRSVPTKIDGRGFFIDDNNQLVTIPRIVEVRAQYIIFQYTYSINEVIADVAGFRISLFVGANALTQHVRVYRIEQNSSEFKIALFHGDAVVAETPVLSSSFTHDQLDGTGESELDWDDASFLSVKQTIKVVLDESGTAFFYIYSHAKSKFTLFHIFKQTDGAKPEFSVLGSQVFFQAESEGDDSNDARLVHLEGFSVYLTNDYTDAVGWSTNSGNSDERTQRVVVATDQAPFTVNPVVSLGSGVCDSTTQRVVICNDQIALNVGNADSTTQRVVIASDQPTLSNRLVASYDAGNSDSNTQRVVIATDQGTVPTQLQSERLVDDYNYLHSEQRYYIFNEIWTNWTSEIAQTGGGGVINFQGARTTNVRLSTIQKFVPHRAKFLVFDFTQSIDADPAASTGPRAEIKSWVGETSSVDKLLIIHKLLFNSNDIKVSISFQEVGVGSENTNDVASSSFLYDQFDGTGPTGFTYPDDFVGIKRRFRMIVDVNAGQTFWEIYSNADFKWIRFHMMTNVDLTNPSAADCKLYAIAPWSLRADFFNANPIEAEYVIESFAVYLTNQLEPTTGIGVADERTQRVAIASDQVLNTKANLRSEWYRDNYRYVKTEKNYYLFKEHYADWDSNFVSTGNGYEPWLGQIVAGGATKIDTDFLKFTWRAKFLVFECTTSYTGPFDTGTFEHTIVTESDPNDGGAPTADRMQRRYTILYDNTGDMQINVRIREVGGSTYNHYLPSASFSEDQLDGTGESQFNLASDVLNVKNSYRIVMSPMGTAWFQLWSHYVHEWITFHVSSVNDLTNAPSKNYILSWNQVKVMINESMDGAGVMYCDGFSLYLTDECECLNLPQQQLARGNGVVNRKTRRVVIATDQPDVSTRPAVSYGDGAIDSNTMRVVIANDIKLDAGAIVPTNDLFGNLTVAEIYPSIQHTFSHTVNPRLVETLESHADTSVAYNDSNLGAGYIRTAAVLPSVSPPSGGVWAGWTFIPTVHYRNGQTAFAKLTGVVEYDGTDGDQFCLWGLFDRISAQSTLPANGIFFGFEKSGGADSWFVGTKNAVSGPTEFTLKVAQGSWNGDSLGITLQRDVLQLFKITFAYLGTFGIDFLIFDPTVGKMVTVHRHRQTQQAVPFIDNPILSIGSVVYVDDSPAGDTVNTMSTYMHSLSGGIYGKSQNIFPQRSHFVQYIDTDLIDTLDQPYVLLILRCAETFNGKTNFARIFLQRISANMWQSGGTSNVGAIKLFKNPTFSNITASDFTDEDSATSIMQYYEGPYDNADSNVPDVPTITDNGTLLWTTIISHEDHQSDNLENIYMEPGSTVMFISTVASGADIRTQLNVLYHEDF